MGNLNISMKKTPAMSPYLIVSDVAKALCFYQQAFGFTLAGEPLIENQEKLFVAMANGRSCFLAQDEKNQFSSCARKHDR